MTHARPRLVLSRCLDLEPCRYNGAAIPTPLVRRLESFVELIPVCPEVEVGLGVPREPIRLVRRGSGTALLQPATGRDLTAEMDGFAESFLSGLPDVEGFLLKARSPSCGIHGVKVFVDAGATRPQARDVGRFARAVRERFPDHPAEHEARLANARLLDDFLTRLFVLADLRRAREGGRVEMRRTHRRHHLTRGLLDARTGTELGELAHAHGEPDWDRYVGVFRRGLARAHLAAGHPRQLQRAADHVGSRLRGTERAELVEASAAHRAGGISRRALAEQLRRGAERAGLLRLAEQSYLDPYPAALDEAEATAL